MSPFLSSKACIRCISIALLFVCASTADAQQKVVLVGDSTVTDGAGWGKGFAGTLPNGVVCENHSAGGRSSKSYRAEGRWEKALAAKPNFVLIQFGHNDMPGKGPERETDPQTTFRQNMADYVREAKQAGATPVLVTSLSRRLWSSDGKRIQSLLNDYAAATRAVGLEMKVPVIDLHPKSIAIYHEIRPAGCETISPKGKGGTLDRTHLNHLGSQLFGAIIADEFGKLFPQLGIDVGSRPLTPTASRRWLAEQSQKRQTPRLVLIGDSTVKNGRGRGDGGLWGWGQVLAAHFNLAIENRALGGRSSRTYLTEGLWTQSLQRLRSGDIVLIQFGHNDGGHMFRGDRPRASIKGNGDTHVEGVVESSGKAEKVHSYGWYLRRYAADAKAQGAIPIILSPVPRDRWKDGRVLRANQDYGKWAKEAAAQAQVLFIDLNEVVSIEYERIGQERVGREFFTDEDWTHTTRKGAEATAKCLADAIQDLADCPLRDYLHKPSADSKSNP